MTHLIVIAAVAAAFSFGCEPEIEDPDRRVGAAAVGPVEPKAPAELPRALEATVRLEPTEGHETRGTITFTQTEDVVRVSGDVHDLPAGEHGFHVHQWGHCDCPDASCAGGHFAPRGMPHGGPDDDLRHVGDLGNLHAEETGRTHVELEDRVISLNGVKSIIGRALVVHANADDLESAPSGNAGPRIACGVIGVTREDAPAVGVGPR